MPSTDNPEASLEHAPAESQQNLGMEAYRYLLHRLRNGSIRPGERLVEADIASHLGVSRVPVRQALLRLVVEGYLMSTPRGYRIPQLEPRDIREVFELRRLLEPRAAAMAARDITPQQIDELNQAIAEAKAGHADNDIDRIFGAAQKWRDTWLSAVGNSRLVATLTRYADQVFVVRQATLSDKRVQRSMIAGYEELVAAFTRHDSVAAADAVQRFVMASEREYATLVAHDQ
ncbi:GntR family transcriptional regulator [Hydrogenophaga sp. OTU3427]|uniref:GntR family transcriptional regulator n=1 Tax=Hydrogenophaga sp. OTU3427 TaxID=3043856 RepID=UPI00313DA950